MKKVKLVITTLCLVATLVIAAPMTARADDGDGPQGTKNSAPQPPPPPPPDWSQILWWLTRL
jgi:hypothetical protein